MGDQLARKSRLQVWLPLTLLAVVGFPLASARAQGAPSTYAELVKEGSVLAERLCSTCHVVSDQPGSVANVGVPSFAGIANKAGQSGERIRNTMISPHPPMPDVRLSNPEIDRLLAYIDSLKSDRSAPPLSPRRGDLGKLVYPDPT